MHRWMILDLWKVKVYLSNHGVCRDEKDNEVEKASDKMMGFYKDLLNLERNYEKEIKLANNDEDSCKEIYIKYDNAYHEFESKANSYFDSLPENVKSQLDDIHYESKHRSDWELADILGL